MTEYINLKYLWLCLQPLTAVPSLFCQPPLTVSWCPSSPLPQLVPGSMLCVLDFCWSIGTLPVAILFQLAFANHHQNLVAKVISCYGFSCSCGWARCVLCWLCLGSFIWLRSAGASAGLSVGIGSHQGCLSSPPSDFFPCVVVSGQSSKRARWNLKAF